MARAATQAGRRTAAPSPPDPTQTVYDEVWSLVTDNDASFSEPTAKETDQQFLQRLTKAVNDLPETVKLSKTADKWFNAACDALEAQKTIAEPEGYREDEAEDADETEAEEADAEEAEEEAEAPAPARSRGAEALRKYNAERKAAKEQPTTGAARRKMAAAEPEAAPTGRRKVAAAAAAPATGRRKVAAPAAAPARKGAAAKKAAAPTNGGESVSHFLRVFVVQNPDCTPAEAATAAEEAGFSPTRSTVGGIVTFTKNTVEVLKELGHWREPRPAR